MATNPAVVDDVQLRWLPYPYQGGEGDVLIQVRLDQVWRALVAELPSLPSRMDAGTVDPATVADVVADAALRVLRNPEGFSEGSSGIDDYRENWKYADATRSSDVYFTRAELRRLSPSQSGAFSIAPV